MSKNNILKNITSLGLVQIANYVLPLISLPVYSRIIGPEKFGVISYAAVFVSYFNILISYGFDYTATREIAKDPHNAALRSKVFSEVFIAQLLLFLLSVFLFAGCLFFVKPLAVEKAVAIFSFFVCIGGLFSQNWLFQAMQDLSKIALFSFIGKLLFTILVLLMIRQQSDYIWQPLSVGLVGILVSVLSFYWAIKRYNLKLIKVPLKRISQLLWTEKTMFFSTVVISLYTTTNTVVLGLMRNELEVGYYSAAQKLIDVANRLINIPLSQVLFPFIGFALGQSREKGLAVIQRIFPLIILLTGAVSIGLFLLGPIVLLWFYGKDFLPCIPAFRVLAWIPMVLSCNNFFVIQLMLNLKMDKTVFYICAGGAVIGLILNVVMTHYMGYIGTAWNWLIVEIYITAAAYVVLLKGGINPINKNNFKYSSILSEVQSIIGKKSTAHKNI